uniref:Nucleoprotein core domain n=1 Tax=Trematomus arenavirus TaxID=3138838 RepID=A0AAU7LK99_9VIRU
MDSGQLSFDQLKKLYDNNSIQDPGFPDEVIRVFEGLDDNFVGEILDIDKRIDDDELDTYLDDLKSINGRARRLHSGKYVAAEDQPPVIVDATVMRGTDLTTFSDDIILLRKKGGSSGKASKGSAENWDKGNREKFNMMRDYGYFDVKEDEAEFTKDAESLFNWAEQNGMSPTLMGYVNGSEFLKPSQQAAFKGSVNKSVNSANCFQLDPSLLLALFFKKCKLDGAGVKAAISCLEIAAKIMASKPLTVQLLKSLTCQKGRFQFLDNLDGRILGLFSTPFILNRQRLTYCLSVWKKVPSRLGIASSRGVAQLLNDAVTLRRQMAFVISPNRDDTNWYGHTLHRTLTTPDPNSVYQNRTGAKKNGLTTVKVVFQTEKGFQ